MNNKLVFVGIQTTDDPNYGRLISNNEPIATNLLGTEL